jgi:hypothetical protein
MYHVINAHIAQVLDGVDFEYDVHSYLWPMEHFPNVNAATDHDFQQRFRRYWQLNAARLSEQFLCSYFGLLENLKGTNEVSVEVVTVCSACARAISTSCCERS